MKKYVNIAILEDNEFYNRVLSRQLDNYVSWISAGDDFSFKINSYIHSEDFLKNLDPETDIAIIDYYLNDRTTGAHVLKEIKKSCPSCKVLIISKHKNIFTTEKIFMDGASEFIYKDPAALAKVCQFVEDVIHSKFSA
jgi:DNA-binding NarL/FixJ family response regulator